MPVSPDEFRSALSRFATGVTVITTKDSSGKLFGITVSAFSSVSLDPPLILICIEKATGSHFAFQESGIFVVNVLSTLQAELSERFASQTADKFESVEFSLSDQGLPMLAGCLANLECRIKNTCDGGDHSIFIAELEAISISEGDPLLYFRSDYRLIGERVAA